MSQWIRRWSNTTVRYGPTRTVCYSRAAILIRFDRYVDQQVQILPMDTTDNTVGAHLHGHHSPRIWHHGLRNGCKSSTGTVGEAATYRGSV